MTRVAVVGTGIVGTRTIRELTAIAPDIEIIGVTSRPAGLAGRCGVPSTALVSAVDRPVVPTVDLAILTAPGRIQAGLARRYLAKGSDVIAVTDDLAATRTLLDLDESVRKRGLRLVVGAGFAPGVSCALARFAANQFAELTELHVAKHGTAGPSCARQHHRALRSPARDVRNGRFVRRPGGSGRELVWFPDPIDGADCYRAEVPDPTLLKRAFPGVVRATSRIAAHRRDRLTSFLPALLPPHPEGGVGAVRVEARGTLTSGQPGAVVVGAAAKPGDAAGSLAAILGTWLRPGGRLADLAPNTISVAELPLTGELLAELQGRGVSVTTFEGSSIS